MKKYYQILIVLLIGLFLANCTSDPMSSREEIPKNTIVPTFNNKSTSINSPTATPTVSPTISLTLTPSTTGTAVPTLSAPEISEIVNELMITNGGCVLPCWWGVTPGKSDLESSIVFFNQLDITGEIRQSTENTNDGTVVEISKGYHFPNEYVGENWDFAWLVTGTENTVTILQIAEKSGDQFTFTNVFSQIGEPDKIYLSTFADVPGYPQIETYLPFDIVLVYDDEHMILWYRLHGQNVNDVITACQEEVIILAWMWDGSKYGEHYKQYILNITGGAYEDGSQNLEEIDVFTVYSIDSFVELFLENPDACIETSAEYW